MRNAVLLVLLAGAASVRGMPENVALHKPYTLSPAPNYGYCTDPGDAVQLTDGRYTEGYFWTQKSTVGWNSALPVLCTIDLGRVEPVRGLSWNCAAGTAGVEWPKALWVLVSDDGRSWTCLGDLRTLGAEAGAPNEKGYAVFRYATDKLRGHGRYVCVVAASPSFCFVDEVEVWRGEDAWLQEEVKGPKTTDPKAFFEENRARADAAERLRADLQAVLRQAEPRVDASAYAALKARAEELARRIPEFAAAFALGRPTVLPYGSLHEDILALNGPVLRAAGIERPVVWQNNRWAPLKLTDLPPSAKDVEQVALDLMRGEVRGEAFNITNPDQAPLDVAVALTGLPPEARLELREVLFTDTQDRTPVAAALKRMEPDAQGAFRLRVPGGCTRQIWLSCRRPEGKAGRYNGLIRLAAPRDFKKDLPVAVRIRDLSLPKRLTLHVGGWDYVQGKADYYRAPGNLEANLALMREMCVDSPWATSAVFPGGAAFDTGGALRNEAALDFSVWDAWVERWQGAANYCVFFSVGDSFEGERAGTPRFNVMVASWLGAWVRHLAKQKIDPGQLVILLVDEPCDLKQDAVIVAWASAVRAANLGVKLFEDPTYADPSKGDPAMFAACDVLCPNTPMMLEQGEPFRAFYRQQREAGRTLWLYSCSGPAKLLDPVTYHRAQAWLAFQMGAEGSFYWAFGCGGGIGDSWHAYAQTGAEYSPYFVGPVSVMEGKHSEAIRESAEDYEYLRMVRDAAGRETAKKPAAWQARAQALLTEGVAEAVRSVSASNLFWQVEKDRSAMDTVRIRALDLLEEVSNNK